MKRLALLAASACLLAAGAAQAADYSIAIFPTKGEKASPRDWNDAYKLALQTPGVNAWFFAAMWSELEDGDHNRFPEYANIRTAAHPASPGFLGIQVINTAERGVPKDLRRKRWTNPEMLVQFDQTLQRLANVDGNKVKWLSIGNEADVYLAAHPDEVDDFVTFYRQAAAAARRYFPNAKIGVTVTFDGITGPRQDLTNGLIKLSDALFVTYYPVSADLTMKPDAQIDADLKAITSAALDKPIFFQELGYPSSSVVGASEDLQAAYFTRMIARFRDDPKVEFVNLFLLHDFSPAVCRELLKYYKLDGEEMSAFLCSLGLIGTNGTPKKSWDAIKAAFAPPDAAPPARQR